jgi:hypothetical protein
MACSALLLYGHDHDRAHARDGTHDTSPRMCARRCERLRARAERSESTAPLLERCPFLSMAPGPDQGQRQPGFHRGLVPVPPISALRGAHRGCEGASLRNSAAASNVPWSGCFYFCCWCCRRTPKDPARRAASCYCNYYHCDHGLRRCV